MGEAPRTWNSWVSTFPTVPAVDQMYCCIKCPAVADRDRDNVPTDEWSLQTDLPLKPIIHLLPHKILQNTEY